MSEVRGQRSEVRGQKAEGRRQKAEDGGLFILFNFCNFSTTTHINAERSTPNVQCQKSVVSGPLSVVRCQMSDVRCQMSVVSLWLGRAYGSESGQWSLVRSHPLDFSTKAVSL